MTVTLDRIVAARRIIAGAVLRTPTLPAPSLSELTGAEVYVKYENLQATSSFKERGAVVKLTALTQAARVRGVIAMSAGNHAQAVAYHARRLGIPATIVMPDSSQRPLSSVNASVAIVSPDAMPGRCFFFAASSPLWINALAASTTVEK